MKKVLPVLSLVLLLIPFLSSSCSRRAMVSESGEQQEKTISVSGFSSIASSGSYHVFVQMGSTESVRVSGDSKRLELMEIKVENNTLKIGSKPRSWSKGSFGTINVYITVRKLEGLTLSGSGLIKVNNTIQGTRLNTAISGSGRIEATAAVKDLNCSISGSGQLNVKGTTDNASFSVSGSGNVHARELKAAIANVQVSGSGNVQVYAEKTLNARVSGSGNIRYAGSPTVNSSKSGSGNIGPI